MRVTLYTPSDDVALATMYLSLQKVGYNSAEQPDPLT